VKIKSKADTIDSDDSEVEAYEPKLPETNPCIELLCDKLSDP